MPVFCLSEAKKVGSSLYVYNASGYVKKTLQITNCYNHFSIIDHLNLDEFVEEIAIPEKTFGKVG